MSRLFAFPRDDNRPDHGHDQQHRRDLKRDRVGTNEVLSQLLDGIRGHDARGHRPRDARDDDRQGHEQQRRKTAHHAPLRVSITAKMINIAIAPT